MTSIHPYCARRVSHNDDDGSSIVKNSRSLLAFHLAPLRRGHDHAIQFLASVVSTKVLIDTDAPVVAITIGDRVALLPLAGLLSVGKYDSVGAWRCRESNKSDMHAHNAPVRY